jgi:hypothetical protein
MIMRFPTFAKLHAFAKICNLNLSSMQNLKFLSALPVIVVMGVKKDVIRNLLKL